MEVEKNGSLRVTWKWLGPTLFGIIIVGAGSWVGYMHSQDAFLTARLIAHNTRISQIEISIASISARLGVLESQMSRVESKVDALLVESSRWGANVRR